MADADRSHRARKAALWGRLRSLPTGPRTTRRPLSDRARQSANHPRFSRLRPPNR
jgi:hypothetical protein